MVKVVVAPILAEKLVLSGTGADTVGPAGPVGPQGVQGVQGLPGISITNVSVSQEGDLEITLSDGTVIDAGAVQTLPGPAGQDGIDGQDGVSVTAAEVNQAGELVLTLSDASTLTAGVVRGQDGIDGQNGADGQDGAAGPAGADGSDGQDAPTITAAVVNQDGSLSLTLSDATVITSTGVSLIGPAGPAGSDGQDGQPGQDGVDGTNGINGIDGQDAPTINAASVNPDGTLALTLSDASVITTTGTSVIGPKGDKGDQGEPGQDGQPGEQGPPGDPATGLQTVEGDPTPILGGALSTAGYPITSPSQISLQPGGQIETQYVEVVGRLRVGQDLPPATASDAPLVVEGKANLGGITYPDLTDGGTAGQILVLQGDNSLAFETPATGGGGGLADLVSDTSPQLGGDLDVNGHKITSASNITLDPQGQVVVRTTSTSAYFNTYAPSGAAVTLANYAAGADSFPALAFECHNGTPDDPEANEGNRPLGLISFRDYGSGNHREGGYIKYQKDSNSLSQAGGHIAFAASSGPYSPYESLRVYGNLVEVQTDLYANTLRLGNMGRNFMECRRAFALTTDATATIMNDPIIIQQNEARGYEITVVARRTNGGADSAMWTFSGMVDEGGLDSGNNAIARLPFQPLKTVVSKAVQAWDVNVSVSGREFRLTVQGGAGHDITWIASINSTMAGVW